MPEKNEPKPESKKEQEAAARLKKAQDGVHAAKQALRAIREAARLKQAEIDEPVILAEQKLHAEQAKLAEAKENYLANRNASK